MNQTNATQNRRNAFSLLELLAVVVILGILAAAIVPRVVTSTSDAKTSVNQHNMAEINAAAERYYMDNDAWTTDINDLVPDYLPDGVPAVPTDASLEYALNASSRAITQAIP